MPSQNPSEKTLSNKQSLGANFNRYTVTLPPELVEIITNGSTKDFSRTVRLALIKSLTDEQLDKYKAALHTTVDQRLDSLYRRITLTKRAHESI